MQCVNIAYLVSIMLSVELGCMYQILVILQYHSLCLELSNVWMAQTGTVFLWRGMNDQTKDSVK